MQNATYNVRVTIFERQPDGSTNIYMEMETPGIGKEADSNAIAQAAIDAMTVEAKSHGVMVG